MTAPAVEQLCFSLLRLCGDASKHVGKGDPVDLMQLHYQSIFQGSTLKLFKDAELPWRKAPSVDLKDGKKKTRLMVTSHDGWLNVSKFYLS